MRTKDAVDSRGVFICAGCYYAADPTPLTIMHKTGVVYGMVSRYAPGRGISISKGGRFCPNCRSSRRSHGRAAGTRKPPVTRHRTSLLLSRKAPVVQLAGW
jgi:hypothetical protein